MYKVGFHLHSLLTPHLPAVGTVYHFGRSEVKNNLVSIFCKEHVNGTFPYSLLIKRSVVVIIHSHASLNEKGD